MQTLGIIFLIFIALLFLAPEVLVLIIFSVLAFLDWISFTITGKHWIE